MYEALVFNIQKFSIHDGPGIRTTIFFKGCPLKCRWCHNPESWKNVPEVLYDRDKCTLCLKCSQYCPEKRIGINGTGLFINHEKECSACAECSEICLSGARELAGKRYSVKELINIALKDRIFYEESGGGVTLSGGEPLIQIEFVERFAKELKNRGINVTIDTSGFVPFDSIKRVIPYTDLFLYDLKIMDDDLHRKYTGQSNGQILKNLKILSDEGALIWLRVPVIGGVNDNERNFDALLEFAQSIKTGKINLLPYHRIAEGKSRKTEFNGIEIFEEVDEKFILSMKKRFENKGFNVAIGG